MVPVILGVTLHDQERSVLTVEAETRRVFVYPAIGSVRLGPDVVHSLELEGGSGSKGKRRDCRNVPEEPSAIGVVGDVVLAVEVEADEEAVELDAAEI